MCSVINLFHIHQRYPALIRVLSDIVDLPLDLWIVMHEDLKRSRRCRVAFDNLMGGLARVGEAL